MTNETKMAKPITVEYLWLYNEPFGGYHRVHTSYTYEDYHRVVRILHEHEDKYKVLSVKRGEVV